MNRATKYFVGVAAGVVLMVAGLYGWFGENSILVAGVGLLVSLGGVVALLITQSRSDLRRPHVGVYLPIGLAIALHLYEHISKSSGGFSYGWLLWALVPYIAVLALSCFVETRVPVIFGAVLALALDAWTHYAVFVEPKGSTAALALIWTPLWNLIIVVPGTTFLARLFLQRASVSPNAP
jgi:hypothetical protein